MTHPFENASPPSTSSRRTFLSATAGGALATLAPGAVLGGTRALAPSERINLASIGVGGMGGGDVATFTRLGANIVALCDVNDVSAAGSFAALPKARRYKDFRVMLDKEAKNIDAVTVGTPGPHSRRRDDGGASGPASTSTARSR